MIWLAKKLAEKPPILRVVSEPRSVSEGRMWTLEQKLSYGWSYITMTSDEVVAQEWIANLKNGGTHRRVEYQTAVES